MAGFDDAERQFAEMFETLFAADTNDERVTELADDGPPVGKPINAEALIGFRDSLAKALGLGKEFPHDEIRVKSQVISENNAHQTDGQDFLNSFIAKDLEAVASEVAAGRLGAALREYLRPDADIETDRRVDVKEKLDTVLVATAPNRIPLGRWPSRPEHPLALSQQLAVNTALEMLDAGSGIFGVNGPPGTGKTTILRDILAALVVERARRLSALAHPRDAFTGTRTWKTDKRPHTVHLWKKELTGFEMVVASATNGAVENVTNEVPAVGAIDEMWRGIVDYFPDIGSDLLKLGREDGKEPPDGDTGAAQGAWALVAARLGNKANRGQFVNTFWYDEKAKNGQTGAKGFDVEHPDAEQPSLESGHPHLLSILKGYEKPVQTPSWEEAVADFQGTVARVEKIQMQRQHVYESQVRLADAERNLQVAQRAADAARRQASALRAKVIEAEHDAQVRETEREGRVRLRVEHQQFRPKALEGLLYRRKAMRDWAGRDEQLGASVIEVEEPLKKARAKLARLASEIKSTEGVCGQHQGTVQRTEAELASMRMELRAAEETLGVHFPSHQWWTNEHRREIAALWTDPAWNHSRTELFLAALRLHKAFLMHAATEMKQSLQAAVDIIKGDAPRDLPEDAAQAAWQALFFVVPVVSTTFASFARLFSHLRQEALGWLFIDEAGQATPQNAVGALWRGRRAVVVGDPLQLEPVVTLPFRAEQTIRKDHGVDEQWLTSRSSVQRRVDRLNRLGTWLPAEDDRIWVGAPLTVHRRCDKPMFGIVNKIAYGDLMIDGTDRTKARAFREAYPDLPLSKWINVVTEESVGHWVPEEGKQLDKVLGVLADRQFDMSEVMVIGPFRDIASKIRRRVRQYPGLTAGTIHTAQGKQADIVILVLGGDPGKPGAKRWAASKPNLLNVACSRAKHRLYVIGNRDLWAANRYFDVLASSLPFTGPTPQDPGSRSGKGTCPPQVSEAFGDVGTG